MVAMPAFGEQPQAEERLPLSQVPEDLTCTLCSPPKQMQKLSGYKGHMSSVHGILFEQVQREDQPAYWRQATGEEAPTEPNQLPVWVKMALVRQELYGESATAVCKTMGKGVETLLWYRKTPAAKKAIEEIRAFTDMKTLVKTFMESATAQMYMDWLMALEWAKEARDHKMVHTMIKDIGLQPILKDDRQQTGPTTLILNLGTNDLKAIEAKSLPVEAIVIDADVIEDEH